MGDLLNDLPALRSTFSQSNSSRFLGTTGLNLLDLRGLGTQRTLVLVNGRRHVGSDILSNAVSPDTNTFPTDLIERIDVVTGGNSAVYGSDAIAGVVNFVLKKDFEGLQFRGQGGQSSESDARQLLRQRARGHQLHGRPRQHRGQLRIREAGCVLRLGPRESAHGRACSSSTDADPPDAVNGSDGIPDRLYYDDVRTSPAQRRQPPVRRRRSGGAVRRRCGLDSQGRHAVSAVRTMFHPDGSLIPQTGERIGLGPNGNFDGGNGSNNRERNALGIYPELERYSFNVFGNLQISEAFAPFIEAKYVRTNSSASASPAFFQGGTIDGDRASGRASTIRS